MKFVSLLNYAAREEVITERTRKIAGAHVLFSATINIASGLVLFAVILSGRLVPLLIRESPRVLSESQIVRYGGLMDPITGWIAPAYGAVLLIVGGVGVLATRDAFAGRYWRRTVAASAAGVLNLLAAPMALIAIALLYLSRHQFEE